MKTLTSGQQTAIDASSIVQRGMVLFDFPSGFYGFWTGAGVITWNTIGFVGARSLITATKDEENISLESNGVVLSLRANAEAGLTPDVLATIESYTYKNRPVTIYRALFDVATSAMIDDPIVEWRGLVDRFVHDENADGDYVLKCYCESRGIDYTRRGPSVRSSQHQNLLSTGDLFFDYVGVAGTAKIFWGTKAAKNLGNVRSQAGKI